MSTGYAEFNNRRLAEIYDYFCPLGKDSDFFLGEIRKQKPKSVLDVGCGSGILTVELAKIAKNVIGVEPAKPMIEIARKRPGGDTVRWVHGFAKDVTDVSVDTIVMTSHVAQFFLSDEEWRLNLKHMSLLVNPGGKIIFDSKNPLVRPWLNWNKNNTNGVASTPYGVVNMWNELVVSRYNLVKYKLHYQFDSGEKLVSDNELIYRSKKELVNSLNEANFEVEHIYGDWNGASANDSSDELIFVARKV